MGSPLGPTFANIFLAYYELRWLENCPVEFKPILYRRYVDDIFLLFENEHQHDQFKEYMNSRHPNMKFTDEKESDNVMPFLDILVIRDTNLNTFSTSVYRKETFSGVMTNWNSCTFYGYKIGVIYTTLHRCYMICSSYKHLHDQFEICKGIFQKNGYPLYTIEFCIMRFLNKIFNPEVKEKNVSTVQKISIVMPYLGNMSNFMKKRIKNLVTKNLVNCDLNIIFSSPKRLRDILKFKDQIPLNLRSFVIYKFKCSSCNATYIGKTFRHFKRRAGEHLGVSHLTNKNYKTPTVTAVSQHLQSEKHLACWEDFQVISSEHTRNDLNLRIKESLLIKKLKPSLVNKSSEPLKLFS